MRVYIYVCMCVCVFKEGMAEKHLATWFTVLCLVDPLFICSNSVFLPAEIDKDVNAEVKQYRLRCVGK